MNEYDSEDITRDESLSAQLFQQLLITVDTMLWHSKQPIQSFSDRINNRINQLLIQSKKDCFYWQFCSVEVYKSTFNQRLERFLSNNTDRNIIDFMGKEKQDLERSFNIELNYPEPIRTESSNEKKILFFNIYEENEVKERELNIAPYFPMDFIETRYYNEIITNQINKIEFLELKAQEIISSETEPNPHRKIFVDKKSFECFKLLTENIGTKHADISFIYRSMLADSYIHQESEGAFNRWINTEMKIPIDSRLQQRERVAISKRKNIYKLILNQFQLKSKTYS